MQTADVLHRYRGNGLLWAEAVNGEFVVLGLPPEDWSSRNELHITSTSGAYATGYMPPNSQPTQIEWLQGRQGFLLNDAERSLDYYDLTSAEGLHHPTLVGWKVTDFSISPDQKHLAVASPDEPVVIYNLDDESEEITCHRITRASDDLKWSPDGETIAAISSRGTLSFCNSSNGERRAQMSDRQGLVWADWSQDGRFLLTYRQSDQAMQIWDAEPIPLPQISE